MRIYKNTFKLFNILQIVTKCDSFLLLINILNIKASHFLLKKILPS